MRNRRIEPLQKEIHASLVLPSGQLVTMPVSIRRCPLTNITSRITPARPLQKLSSAPLVVPPSTTNNAGCPFCEPQVWSATPTFPKEFAPTPRLSKGTSLIFPNISPYGAHSAVLLLSLDHYIPMGCFSVPQYQDTLTNSQQYLTLVAHKDPEAHFVAITQNILPSSGGALVHPHLQVNADSDPMGYHRALLNSCQEWDGKLGGVQGPDGSHLLSTWAAQESDGPRFVATSGPWTLAAAYAPAAQEEFHLFYTGKEWSLQSLNEGSCQELARLVVLVQRFWHSRGFNSGHLVLLLSTRAHHPPMARLLLRATYEPWYRNDQSCYEVGCWEPSRDVSPEQLAQATRSFSASTEW